MMHGFRLVPFLLLVLASPLAAQAPDARLMERFAPDDARVLGGLIDSLAAAGAPADPLVLKALEGASKGATPARVEFALRALGRGLLDARSALGAASDASDITAGAAALRAGAKPAALTAVRAARPTGPVAMPLGTMADLMSRGVPAARAEQVVLQMVRRGAVDAEFGAVANTVADGVRSGTSGSTAATGGKLKPNGAAPPGPPAGIPGNGSRNDPPGKANGGAGTPGGTGIPPTPGRPPDVGGGNGNGPGRGRSAGNGKPPSNP